MAPSPLTAGASPARPPTHPCATLPGPVRQAQCPHAKGPLRSGAPTSCHPEWPGPLPHRGKLRLRGTEARPGNSLRFKVRPAVTSGGAWAGGGRRGTYPTAEPPALGLPHTWTGWALRGSLWPLGDAGSPGPPAAPRERSLLLALMTTYPESHLFQEAPRDGSGCCLQGPARRTSRASGTALRSGLAGGRRGIRAKPTASVHQTPRPWARRPFPRPRGPACPQG